MGVGEGRQGEGRGGDETKGVEQGEREEGSGRGVCVEEGEEGGMRGCVCVGVHIGETNQLQPFILSNVFHLHLEVSLFPPPSCTTHTLLPSHATHTTHTTHHTHRLS